MLKKQADGEMEIKIMSSFSNTIVGLGGQGIGRRINYSGHLSLVAANET